jgi:redox-sensitive bicupin YhaK (pirin superfamily)
MLQIRKSEERGFANHGWLKSHHSFSFADYFDPKHMGFRSLRVINEDYVDAGMGFDPHPHRDMEIITYVVEGSLSHEDSMGTKAIIKPGEVQRMSAGTGIVHSEYNSNEKGKTHLFQIWIMPKTRGGSPGYGQKSFEKELNEKKLVLTISESGRDGSIAIKQDADMYVSRLKDGDETEFELRPGRGAWVQVVRGSVSVDGETIAAGDALAIDDSGTLKFKAIGSSEFILFDLA